MSNPYGPILTGVGLISNGRLTDAARTRYVEEVIALLVTGNRGGRGGSPTTQLFSSIVPLPPMAGPKIVNATTLKAENLFWFEPDPFAALTATVLLDRSASPVWNALFPDLLYAKTAAALDANGSTPLFPIFDASVAFPSIKAFPLTLPELAIQANITPLPKLLLKLSQLGIQLSLPSIPIPPVPPALPTFGLPALPGLTLPGLPDIFIPELFLGLIKLPFDILLKLVVPPDLGLVLDLPGLPKIALDIAMNIVIDLLQPLIPIVPKLLVASILVYVKDVVAMVCTDVVGMLVGAGGSMTKTMAGLTGLV